MKIIELQELLSARILAGDVRKDETVATAYAGDMLSDVLALGAQPDVLLTGLLIISGHDRVNTDFQTIYYFSVTQCYQRFDLCIAPFLPEFLFADHYIPEESLIYTDIEPLSLELMISLIMAAQSFLQDVIAGHLGQPLTHHPFVLLEQLCIYASLI